MTTIVEEETFLGFVGSSKTTWTLFRVIDEQVVPLELIQADGSAQSSLFSARLLKGGSQVRRR